MVCTNYEEIIDDLIRNQNDQDSYRSNIGKLVECCKIPLTPPWEDDPIGYTLCFKTLIEFLNILYSETNGDVIYNKKLSPLGIFKEIHRKHIRNIIYLFGDKNLINLSKSIRRHGLNDHDGRLNRVFIDDIQGHVSEWDMQGHNKRVEMYHLMILYIYASHNVPRPW